MSETRYDSGYCFLCRSHHCVGHDTGISDADRAAVPAPVGAETREGALAQLFAERLRISEKIQTEMESGVRDTDAVAAVALECRKAITATWRQAVAQAEGFLAVPAAASASKGAERLTDFTDHKWVSPNGPAYEAAAAEALRLGYDDIGWLVLQSIVDAALAARVPQDGGDK